jgi:murein DD-endopeptidase MepM/ murein hydrolase activator NlpD
LIAIEAYAEVDAPTVTFMGKSFRTWSDGAGGWLGLVAVDRDAELGTSRMVLTSAGSASVALASAPVEVVSGNFKIQRLNVDERTVTLSEEDQKRASAEHVDIVKTINVLTAERVWRKSFTNPVKGPVTGHFGSQRVYNGKPGGYHSGMDLAAPKGTPVKPSSEGRVVFVGDLFYTGNSVFIDHGLGLITGYYHLDTVAVENDELVGADTIIGQVGSTGRSTGPHLHWSVYLGGTKVDPPSLIKATGR